MMAENSLVPSYNARLGDWYKCHVCGGTYRENGIRCLAIHPPGHCCHYQQDHLDGGNVGTGMTYRDIDKEA